MPSRLAAMPDSTVLLVRNARILTQDARRTVIENGALAIAGGKIIAVGPTDELAERFPSAAAWDARRRLVLPGLINTHNHLFQTFMRGLGKDLPFMDWIAKSVRRLMPLLDDEAVYLAAIVGCLEAVRTGTTTIVDFMYAMVKTEFADAVIRAIDDIGMRGVLARGVSDQEMIYGTNFRSTIWEPIDKSLAEIERLRRQYQQNPRISLMAAPNAVWLVTTGGFAALTQYAQKNNLPLTMHLLETSHDDDFCMEQYGMRALPFLARSEVLNSQFIAVHSIRMQPDDFDLMAQYDVKVSHNPVSNMILGSGVCPVPELAQRGVAVGLGTDGAASNDSQNMLETMKTAAILQKVHHRDAAALSAEAVFSMATDQGARVVGMSDQIGSLERGKRADFVVVELLRPNTTPSYDAISSLVYSGSEGNIDAVAVSGEFIYENGNFKRVNEGELLARAERKAMELYRRTAES